MPKSNSRRVLERRKRFNREWFFQDDIASMKDQELDAIEQELGSDSPAAKLNVADSLGRLASWYGALGQIALLDGSVEGWAEIQRSWLYQALSLRTRIAVFQRGRVLGKFRPVKSLALEANPSAICLAYSLVLGKELRTTFFGDAVRVMVLDKDVVREDFWQYHPLGPFLVQLLALSRNQPLGDLRRLGLGLGPYQSIIDGWDNPSVLAKGIFETAEFHCQRIEDTSGDFFSEFRNPPFDLVPAEILAIYSVRHALVLDTPNVQHPLLEPPFNKPIGSPSEIQDEMLDRIEALI